MCSIPKPQLSTSAPPRVAELGFRVSDSRGGGVHGEHVPVRLCHLTSLHRESTSLLRCSSWSLPLSSQRIAVNGDAALMMQPSSFFPRLRGRPPPSLPHPTLSPQGTAKGAADVTFVREADARAALRLNQTQFEGRFLHVLRKETAKEVSAEWGCFGGVLLFFLLVAFDAFWACWLFVVCRLLFAV